ncbi:MAG: S8 family serine peptidase [Bacteriovoracales bacterium]|nr:S8 family serine peptidase [Bacteriovoracales bacterium]
MTKKFFIPWIVLITSLNAFGADRFIVQYKNDERSSQHFALPRDSILFDLQTISKRHGLYTVRFPLGLGPKGIHDQLNLLRSLPGVEDALVDRVVTQRTQMGGFPNDSFQKTPIQKSPTDFGHLQWNLQRAGPQNPGSTDAESAWDEFGTDGVDAYGREIVVAVVDSGFDLAHEDLVDNFFVNTGEIPGNGLDDDSNGYVDDFVGWSLSKKGPLPHQVTSDFHGTHVAGIVGARGGDGVGVSGVNWNVKILPVQLAQKSGRDRQLFISQMITAYTYIMDMKRQWLSSEGLEGANIVATNTSIGINSVHCKGKDHSIWDKLYDEMGSLGIVSVVAVANRSYNIDERGDIPATCTSEYIISVSSIDRDGHLGGLSAWGPSSVDLLAPGMPIYSTAPHSAYRFGAGTSVAAPHVSGAVAYLYSVAHENFIELYDTAPEKAALTVKKILLDSTFPMPELVERVATGGRLDLYRAAKRIYGYGTAESL